MKMILITPSFKPEVASASPTVKQRQYAYLAVASIEANMSASVTSSEPETRWIANARIIVKIPRTACSGHLKSIVTHSNAKNRSNPYTRMRAMLAHALDLVPSNLQCVRICFIARSSAPALWARHAVDFACSPGRQVLDRHG